MFNDWPEFPHFVLRTALCGKYHYYVSFMDVETKHRKINCCLILDLQFVLESEPNPGNPSPKLLTPRHNARVRVMVSQSESNPISPLFPMSLGVKGRSSPYFQIRLSLTADLILSPPQATWNSCSFLNKWGMLLPRGLCTGCSLSLESSSPRYQHGSLPYSLKALLNCHLLNETYIHHPMLLSPVPTFPFPRSISLQSTHHS